jgi:hypothetical protein
MVFALPEESWEGLGVSCAQLGERDGGLVDDKSVTTAHSEAMKWDLILLGQGSQVLDLS